MTDPALAPTLRTFKVFTPTVHGGIATIVASQVQVLPSGVLVFIYLQPVDAEHSLSYIVQGFNAQQWLAFEEVTAAGIPAPEAVQ